MLKIVRPITYLFILLAVFLAGVFPFASPVYASTQTRALNGEGAQTDGIYQGTGSVGTYVDLSSIDGDLSYLGINIFGAEGWRCWNTTDTAITGTINSITFTVQSKYVSAVPDLSRLYTHISGTNYYVAYTETSGYTNHSATWTTNPATGLAWSIADYNSAQFGVYVLKAGIPAIEAHYTYAYITIDYTAISLPSVTATAPTTYDDVSATLIGNITATGGETPDNYGFVWDTADKGDPGNVTPAGPPGAWANGWAVGAGSYGVAQYTHATGNTLSKNTTYYIRFAAHNSVGWEYSTAVSFKTIDDPNITTLAATAVGKLTATLNAQVTDDGKVGGGEECTVTFIYKSGNHADYAAILAAGGTETAATGTWNTGEFPSKNISGLVASTQYSFAVKIINSTATTVYGARLLFTTTSGVSEPSNLVAIPNAITCSLSWVKGSGAPSTLVRYRTGSYPAATNEGTVAYLLGSGTSVSISSLTPGTTYYVSAWGYDSGTYSAAYTTVLFTTLASTTAGGDDIEVPPANSSWTQTPSETKVSNIPLIGGIITEDASSYEIPENMLWYFLWVLGSVGMGIIAYNRFGRAGQGSFNLPLGAGVTGIGFACGAALGLTMLWIMEIGIVIVIGIGLWSNR